MLLLTPLLIGLISLADRRWGASVGGWLVGLPLTSAPVTAFVALELGPAFAAQMALGILLGLISQAVFCVTYASLAARISWLGCWLIVWAAFGVTTTMVLVLTSAASLLGPRLSGLLAPLPIFATVFAVFAHSLQGAAQARQIVHGVVVSSFACAVFFLVVGTWIGAHSLAATFGVAALCAVLTQGALLRLVRSLPLRAAK